MMAKRIFLADCASRRRHLLNDLPKRRGSVLPVTFESLLGDLLRKAHCSELTLEFDSVAEVFRKHVK
jgi:hypothetical protein